MGHSTCKGPGAVGAGTGLEGSPVPKPKGSSPRAQVCPGHIQGLGQCGWCPAVSRPWAHPAGREAGLGSAERLPSLGEQEGRGPVPGAWGGRGNDPPLS